MKLFGTDGIRGKVGESPITTVDMKKIGFAIAKSMPGEIVHISNDGRLSSEIIQRGLEEGILNFGNEVQRHGLLSTPALSYFLNRSRSNELKCGIQITASHNPYQDNGIKVFDNNGLKITEEQESRIEYIYNNCNRYGNKNFFEDFRAEFTKKPRSNNTSSDLYVQAARNYLRDKVQNKNNAKMLIMIDCANGATSEHVAEIFNGTDADNIIDVISIHDQPDGKNINEKCGATHIETLIKEIESHNKVNERKIDLGVAFDGDGDRAIFVTTSGDVVDGDEILYIFSKFRKKYKNYEGPVVGTLMTNYGIHSAYEELGINFYATDIGDKFVYEKMEETNAEIGGESSGHIITTDFIDIPIGDGIITLINLLEVLSKSKEKNLDDLKKMTSKYIIPSKLINIPVSDKDKFMKDTINQKVFSELDHKVINSGRVLIRASGTENLIRLLIEHQDLNEINKLEKYFCDNIQKT